MYSVALSGLSFVDVPVPGVLPFGQAQAENTPACGLSRLDFVDLWFGAYLPDTNKRKYPFCRRSWNAAAGTEL